MLAIENPFPQFFELDGRPLDAGYVYIGIENQNPETAPITVYWDAAMTLPAAQPLRTKNGRIARNGSPAMVFAATDHSMTVLNSKRELVFTAPSSDQFNLWSKFSDFETDINTQMTAFIDQINDMLNASNTVDAYKLVGDANDAPSFLRMAADTGGTIRLLDKQYFVGQLNLPDYEDLRILGAGMPLPTAALDSLVGGSVIVGGLRARATRALLKDFGLDNGSARGTPGITDGLICDAPEGQTGSYGMAVNVAVMGPTSAGTTHALLMEGYDRSYYSNIYVAKHYYGVVPKNRNTIIDGVSADDIGWAAVYPRSSLPAGAGNVANGTAANIKISNVDHRAASANVLASAVRIEADTVSVSRAQVVNVATLYGRAALILKGGGSVTDPNVSGVTYTNIRGDDSQYAVVLEGYNYDCIGTNIQGANLKTGRALIMPLQSFAWYVSGVQVAITDASITSDVCMEVYGTGAWDNVVVRNAFRKMKVQQSWGSLPNIRTGTLGGDAVHSLDGPLTLVNGATAVAAPNDPKMRILPGSFVQFTGRVTVAANKSFALLPSSSFTDRPRLFPVGVVRGSSFLSMLVNFNAGFDLNIESTSASGDIIDLSTICFAA